MSGLVKFDFKGLNELDASLTELPDKIQDQVVRAGLTAAAKVFQDGMKLRAPKAAHHRVMRRGSAFPVPLSESIGTRVRVGKQTAVAEVGPMTRAFWGRFQELGTRYQSPQPFMVPTLDSDAQIATAAFLAVGRQKLSQVVQQVARKAAP